MLFVHSIAFFHTGTNQALATGIILPVSYCKYEEFRHQMAFKNKIHEGLIEILLNANMQVH